MLSHKHYSTAALLAAFTAMTAVPSLNAADHTVDSSTNATVTAATGDTVTVGATDTDVTIADSSITPLVQVGTTGTAATAITIDQNGSVTFSSSATAGDVILYDSTESGNTGFKLDLAAGKSITYTANGTAGSATVVAAGDAGVVLTLGDGSNIYVNATTGKAYAIVSGQNVDSSVTGITGNIAATGKTEAKAIKAAGTVNTGAVSGTVKATAETTAIAIEGVGAITVGNLAANAEISGTAQTTAKAIAGSAAITIGDLADDAVIKALATDATLGSAIAISTSNSGKITLGVVGGDVTATGVASAKAITTDGEVEVGNVSGNITAAASKDDGTAQAIAATGAVVVGDVTGNITAAGPASAQAIKSDAAVTVGNVGADAVISATASAATGTASAVASDGASAKVTIGTLEGTISATAGHEAAAVESTNGAVEIGKTSGITGNIIATATADNGEAQAVFGKEAVELGALNGSAKITASGKASASAISGQDAITIGAIAADADITAVSDGAAGKAVGVLGETDAKKITIGAVAGDITANGTVIAAAVSGEGDVELGAVSGKLAAVTTADNGEAEGVYGKGAITIGNLDGEASISATGKKFGKAVSGDAAITIGDIAENANITATSDGAAGIAAGIVTEGAAKITVGAVAGNITANGAAKAAAVSGEGEVELGAVSGNITATTTADSGEAEGIYGAGAITVAGISGKVSATGATAKAISGDAAVTTGDITGTVSAAGTNFANAIYSKGALSTTISGTVSATASAENGVAAAISTVEYKDLGGGNMGWDTANSGANDDAVTINKDAKVIGDIRLGKGTDTVTFNGAGSYDYTMYDVENLAINGTAVTIADFATKSAEEKQAAIFAAIKDDNTWTLTKNASIAQLDVNSGFLKVDGTITASGAANIDAGAGVIFHLTDDTKIVADSVTLGDDSYFVAKQSEILTADKIYEVVVSTNDITNNGIEYAIEDTVLVDYEVVAAETDPAKKIVVKATYKGMENVVAGSGNGVGAAGAFETAATDAGAAQDIKDIMVSLQNMTSKSEVAAAVKKLSPEGSLAVAQASASAAAGFSGQMSSRSGSVGGASSMASADADNAYPLLFSGPSLRDENGYEAWTSAFGSKTDQDDNNGVAGFESEVFGSVIGIDRMNDNFLVGAALGFAVADIDTNNNLGSTDLDALSLGAYFAYAPSALKYEGGVTYTYGQADFSRNTLSGTAKAEDVDSYAITTYFGSSYDFVSEDSRLTISPNARLAYTYFNQDGYKEKGAGSLSLNVDSFHNDIVTGTVGVTTAYKLDETLTLNGLLAYKYDFNNDAAEVDSTFLSPGATPFTSKGIETDKTAIEIGGGFDWKVSDKLKASCDYVYEHRDSSDTQTLTFGLNLLF